MSVHPSIIAFVVCLALCDQMPVLSLFICTIHGCLFIFGEEKVSCSHVCVPSKNVVPSLVEDVMECIGWK
jgi:hypothetical protein